MNCLANIDAPAIALALNDPVVAECEHCEGSGYVGRGHPNDPCPDLERCECCDGKGEVVVAAEPADDERMEEATE